MRDDHWLTPELRVDLVKMVARRVPPSDVEDVVQATLADALARGVGRAPEAAPAAGASNAASGAPSTLAHDPRVYVFGIARHKIADFYRRSKRESFDVPELAATPEPHEAESMLRWAQSRAGNDNQTLGWLLRESEGDALETIAADAQLPAPRVRKRVSRLRQHLRDHWRRDLLALAALGIAGALLVLYLRHREEPPIARDRTLPSISPDAERMARDERAQRLRKDGLEACQQRKFEACLRDLDAARELAPAGDAEPAVQSARREAADALRAPQPVAPMPSAEATPSFAPRPPPSPALTASMPPPYMTGTPMDAVKPVTVPSKANSETPSLRPSAVPTASDAPMQPTPKGATPAAKPQGPMPAGKAPIGGSSF